MKIKNSIRRTGRLLRPFRLVVSTSTSPSFSHVTLSDPNAFTAAAIIFWSLIIGLFAFFALGIMLETQEEYQKDIAKGLAKDPHDTVDRTRNKVAVYAAITMSQLIGTALMMWNGGEIEARIGREKPTAAELAEI